MEVEEPVCVLVIADETEGTGDEDDDLDPNVERVEVLVEVIVLVDIDEEVNRRVNSEDFVDVVFFVDVIDAIEVSVGTT